MHFRCVKTWRLRNLVVFYMQIKFFLKKLKTIEICGTECLWSLTVKIIDVALFVIFSAKMKWH
jgi:hypothetical protein